MIGEELEFRISRYIDGDLSPTEAAALQAEIAGNAAAQALVAEYRALAETTRSATAALPDVNWDRLADRLSAATVGRPAIAPDRAADPGLADTLEFAIACAADGTLPADEQAGLDERLRSDPVAAALVIDYASLDGAMKRALPLPPIDWLALTGRISAAVAALDDRVAELPEEAEFALSLYAEDGLPDDRVSVVEDILARRPEARIAVAEYRALDNLLKSSPPLPHVKWAALADHLSAAVAAEAEAADRADTVDEDAPPLRLPGRGRSGSLWIGSWVGSPMRLAAAASVVLAVGIGGMAWLGRRPTSPAGGVPSIVSPGPALASSITVEPLAPEPAAAGGTVAEVQVGPPSQPAVADAAPNGPSNYADADVVSRPSRTFVAGGMIAPREGTGFPY